MTNPGAVTEVAICRGWAATEGLGACGASPGNRALGRELRSLVGGHLPIHLCMISGTPYGALSRPAWPPTA